MNREQKLRSCIEDIDSVFCEDCGGEEQRDCLQRVRKELSAILDEPETAEPVPYGWAFEFTERGPQVDFIRGAEKPSGWVWKSFPLYTTPPTNPRLAILEEKVKRIAGLVDRWRTPATKIDPGGNFDDGVLQGSNFCADELEKELSDGN